MRDVTCPKCGRDFSVEETAAESACPGCNENVTPSTSGASAPEQPGPQAIQSAVPVSESLPSGLESLIPVRNMPALVAYYLGIFSLMPCLGLLLCIPACVLGIIGLVKASRHPEVKGKVHAWIGVFAPLYAVGTIALLFLVMRLM